MSNQSVVYQPAAIFTWKIEKFSSYNEAFWSDTFCVGGYKWRIRLNPKGRGWLVNLYIADSSALPSGWNISTKFSISVINQNNRSVSNEESVIAEKVQHNFLTDRRWGFYSTLSFEELHNPDNGYIVNNTCIIEADVRILNSTSEIAGKSLTHLDVSKINVGGEEIELTKAEITKRAKAVVLDPPKASEALNGFPDVSLTTDTKSASSSSSSSVGFLFQAIARQETLVDIIINLKDENRQLKTKLEDFQHQFNNVEAELIRLKKEAEQSAKELEEMQDVKKSDMDAIDAKFVYLQESLIEEKKIVEGVTAIEFKEKCLNMYSVGYLACEKDMKSILEEMGFRNLLIDSDNEESIQFTQEET